MIAERPTVGVVANHPAVVRFDVDRAIIEYVELIRIGLLPPGTVVRQLVSRFVASPDDARAALDRLLDEARREEREECAEIADPLHDDDPDREERARIAAAIRARG